METDPQHTRLAPWLAILAALSLVAAACAPAAPGTPEPVAASPDPVAATPDPVAPSPDEPVELVVFAFQEVPPEFLQPQLNEYEQANPGVTIQYIAVPYIEFLPTLRTMIEGGAQIDVMLVNGDSFNDMVSLDLLRDVTDEIAFYDRFDPNYYESFYELNGRRYGVPTGIGFYFVYAYNQLLFERITMAPPADFDELERVADALNDLGVLPFAFPGRFNLAFSKFTHFGIDHISGNDAANFTRDTVAGRIKFTDPRWHDVWRCAIRWVDLQAIGGLYFDVDQPGAIANFSAGGAGMIASSNARAKILLEAEEADPSTLQLGLFLPPLCPEAPPGTRQRAMTFPGNTWAVYSGSEHPEEAIHLIDFLSSDPVAEVWMTYYDTNLTFNENASFEGDLEPRVAQGEEWMGDAFTAPDWIMGLQLFTSFQEELTRVVRGEQTIEEGLQRVEEFRVSIQDELPTY